MVSEAPSNSVQDVIILANVGYLSLEGRVVKIHILLTYGKFFTPFLRPALSCGYVTEFHTTHFTDEATEIWSN